MRGRLTSAEFGGLLCGCGAEGRMQRTFVEGRTMEESDKIVVDDLPWFAWQRLPAHVKTDVLGVLEPMAGKPPEQWPARVRTWKPESNLYVLPTWVGPDELYVFVSPEGCRIRIEAMYLREFIDKLRPKRVVEAS